MTDLELWSTLGRHCSAAGAFDFGVSLLDVLQRMGAESRTDFLRCTVENAAAAAGDVSNRLKDGTTFARLANFAFDGDEQAKLRAMAEYLELKEELPELSVEEFFTEVVGVSPPKERESPTVPTATTGLPTVQEFEPTEHADGSYSVMLPNDQADVIELHLENSRTFEEADWGTTLARFDIPIRDGHWFLLGLYAGERGVYVEAYIEDAAGMERATFSPRKEFFGEYECKLSGKDLKLRVLRD